MHKCIKYGMNESAVVLYSFKKKENFRSSNALHSGDRAPLYILYKKKCYNDFFSGPCTATAYKPSIQNNKIKT